MKWKLLLRRLSISAPRMTVRTHIPWPLLALRRIALVGLGGVLALFLYDAGREVGVFPRHLGRDPSADLRDEVKALSVERDRLRADNLSFESRVTIERAAQQQLASQVMQLERENMRLKEDLAFFESLLPAVNKSQGVIIRSARLQTDPDGRRLRYKLLVMQGGKPNADFKGSVQLVVNLQEGDKSVVASIPEKGTSDPALRLSFRYYQRVEGAWTVPSGAVVKAVEVRVLDGANVRAQQTVNL